MPALHIVRHGEPLVRGVMLGRTDPVLSVAGREQMSHLQIDAHIFYTSPLRRASESAAIIAGDRPVCVIENLAEICLGDWDGKSWLEIEREAPALAAAKLAHWQMITPPGGEPWSAFTHRVDRALQIIRAGPLPACVVAHIAVNAWLAHRLSGTDPICYSQEYSEIRTYEI